MASVRLTKADLEKYPHLANRINASLLESERDELPKGEQGVDVKCKLLEPHNNKEEAVRLIRRRKLSLIVVACLALGLFGTVAYASGGLDSNMVELIRSLIRDEIVATNRAVTNPGSPSATYYPPQPTVPDPQVARLTQELNKANQEYAKAETERLKLKDRLEKLGKPKLGLALGWKNYQGWVYVNRPFSGGRDYDTGIQTGSFITAINGEKVTPENFYTVLNQYVPGEVVSVTTHLNGVTETINVRLQRQ